MAQPLPFPNSSPIRQQPPSPSPSHSRTSTPSSNRHDHPYMIRTTSSSLLTRSNSIGAVHKPHGQYPATITPKSPALGRSQGRGHKHTKSQSSVPPSLPPPPSDEWSNVPLNEVTVPPSPGKLLFEDEVKRRMRRSDTMPSIRPSTDPVTIKVEDLPTNPKVWTSSHLGVYLSSALRLKSGGSLPAPVIKDIAQFVVNQKLSGRVFLRLTQKDLEDMGMNQLWRPALLNASRSLRQNVVQGRIWGFGSTPEDDLAPPSPSPSTSSTAVSSKHSGLPSFPTTVFEDEFSDREPEERYESQPDERFESQGWIARGMLSREPSSGTGKVKELVANIERSASGSSADEMSHSPEPFDFTSPESSNREAVLEEDQEEEKEPRGPLAVEEAEAGYASSELTSGSEAEDEAEVEADMELGNITTLLEDEGDAHRTPNKAGIEPRHDNASSSDDISPTSSILPQTPPPEYIGVGAPISPAKSTSPKHTRSPSNTIVLSSTRYLNKDSGSDETIENLIANFTAEDHPLAGSWGANAWLDQSQPEHTARKIHDSSTSPVQVSISKRGNRIVSIGRASGKSKHKPRTSLTELFEDPATKVDAVVGTDAEVDNTEKEWLAETQAHQERLLEEFRARLEEVERRLEEIESRDAQQAVPESHRKEVATETDLPIAGIDTDVKALSTDFDAFGIATDVKVMPPVGEVQLLDVTNKDEELDEEEEEEGEWEDPSLSGLPSYVFLVGLGMAAVVMRVMIRKVVGGKKPLLTFS